jgi:hypothetical protein
MGKLVLNVGATNNDKTGDTLRAGGLKIKSNFEEIYQALANDGVHISGGNLLKTGDYSDLRNKPNFSAVAVSGSFFDLEARPDIGIFVGAPPNSEGSEGHVAGNLAFDGNNLYVCREDYVAQAQFTNFIFNHEEDFVDFHLQARFSNADNIITLRPGVGLPAPSVDWTVYDGATRRTITMVSTEVDGDGQPYYLCRLDGTFVSVINTYYEVTFSVSVDEHVFCAQWKPEYQALLDAHDEGQGSKLYVTYDGYGRTITQIIHDSIDDEITITYSAGSKIADYEGIIVKLDQPKIWKSIPWAPYGEGFAGLDLGLYKFSGSILGTQGAEAGTWGNTGIGIDPGGESNAGVWIPRVADQAAGANLEIYNNNAAGGSIRLLTGSGAWEFKNNGSTLFPTLTTNLHNGGDQNAQTLKFADPNQQVIITGPTPNADVNAQRLIIQGQRGSGTGEGGDVYIWAGDSDVNGGDIKIYAGDADAVPGNGGYVNIDGGSGYAYGGTVEITGGTANEHGGNVNIRGGSATNPGVVNIVSSSYTWTFDASGNITLPSGGDIKNSSGVSVLSPSSPTGQHDFIMDEVNIEATLTEVNFNLLLTAPAIGYMGSDTHTIVIPAGNPGQRFVLVNLSSLCAVNLNSDMHTYTIPPSGSAEFVFIGGIYGNGWQALYGTV